MLRSARSIPALRASAFQQRTLASSTLFSRAWEKEKLPTIKAELKTRGLSTTGNKPTLVSRIKQAEAALATPASRQASSKPPTKSEESEETILAPEEVEISSSQTSEVPKASEVTQTSTERPGIPDNQASPGASAFDNVALPARTALPEPETPIPTILSQGSSEFPPTPAAEEESASSSPKVLTTASASTHIGDGPRSGLHASGDATAIDLAENDEENAGPKEFKYQKRPLNDEERSGLLVGGLIVAGGAFLGHFFSTKKPSSIEGKLEKKVGDKIQEGKDAIKGKADDLKGKAEDAVEKGKKKAEDAKNAVKEKTK